MAAPQGRVGRLTSNVRNGIVADQQEDPRAGYRNVPDEDRKAARKFFDYAHQVAGAGQFDYAIEMFIQGLDKDPEDVAEHQLLREVSLKRKASGGKPLGMFKKPKPSKEDKQNMLNAEKMLAYDPGNKDLMVDLLQNAVKAGCYDTVLWLGPILLKANHDSPKPEFSKYIALKDVYKSVHEWGKAVEACHHAVQMKPDDMDLTGEFKHLSALETMSKGKYDTAKSFRDSVRDRDSQEKLLQGDKDVQSQDYLLRVAREAEAEWRRDPNEAGKLSKYIDALMKTERPEQENQAIDVLEEAYQKTKQFRWRQKLGQVKLGQLARMERAMKAQLQSSPNDPNLKKELIQFQRERAEEELNEFKLWAENYPTDTKIKYDVATRMFALGRFSDAIPVFQQVRQDPKYRTDAAIALGRCFLEAGFAEEATETLRGSVEEYVNKGDPKSIEMYYWFARALEQQGDRDVALKAYSQVAQWNFNYRDVQARIKNLRSGGGGAKSVGAGGSQPPTPASV